MAGLKYDETSDLMLGSSLIVFVTVDGAKLPVAFAKSYGLDINADTIDTANLMSGAWKSSLPGQLGWSVTSDAFVSKQDGHLSHKKLKELMAKRKAIDICFAPLKTADAGLDIDEAGKVFEGKAFVTSLSLKGESNGVAEYSLTLQGSGELS